LKNLKEILFLENLGADGKTILKLDLKGTG
jgi:hypothetical protein